MNTQLPDFRALSQKLIEGYCFCISALGILVAQPCDTVYKKPRNTGVGVGVRVVRGPDWSADFENQDGGEGHLGTLVEICGQSDMYPKDCVVVQWDNGDRNVYRAGYEKACDLRVYDNAGIGVKHEKSCSGCNINNIWGMLWTSQQSPDVNLCTDCYGEDKCDINHTFRRFDFPGDEGVNLPKRSMSRKVAAMGIFEKSEVQRGPDWRWKNQDGGPEKIGEVIAIVNFSTDTDHNAAEVTWQNGDTNVYRLGYKGRLDLKCVRPAKGGYYYKDHLPTLKTETPETVTETNVVNENVPAEFIPVEMEPERSQSPAATQQQNEDEQNGSDTPSGNFKPGDRVKIGVDRALLQMIEQSTGAWKSEKAECIGKVGKVILCRGVNVTAEFEDAGRWTFNETGLTKMKEFKRGEFVKVKDNINNVRMLQEEQVGWNDQMKEVIGHTGKVEEVDEDGDILVNFGTMSWTFNPDCLMETDGNSDGKSDSESVGNQSRDDDSKQEPAPSQPISPETPRPAPTSDDQKLEELFGLILVGDSGQVGQFIQRDPQLMLMDYGGDFAIHKAAQYGHTDVAKTLFGFAGEGNQLEVVDRDGNTPLLSAVRSDQLEMVEFLIKAGAKKNAADNNSETAVHIAVKNSKVPMLKLLKTLQFDANLKNTLQQTPLFEAIAGEDAEILTILFGWPDIDIKSADSIGFTPFTAACRRGNRLAVIGLLEIEPEELNRQKRDGNTGLHVAIQNTQTEIVKTLVSQPGIDVNVANIAGQTPLQIALEDGVFDIAKILVGSGADVMTTNREGKTSLHLCMESIKEPGLNAPAALEMAKVLLEKGVSPAVRDSSDKVAAEYLSGGPLEAQFKDLVEKHERSKKDGGGTRGAGPNESPRSLPASFETKEGPKVQEGPASMTNGLMENQFVQPASQDQTRSEIDPELCEVCDEEAPRFQLLPCRHMVCDDCKPPRKAKKKLCNFCVEPVTAVVDFNR